MTKPSFLERFCNYLGLPTSPESWVEIPPGHITREGHHVTVGSESPLDRYFNSTAESYQELGGEEVKPEMSEQERRVRVLLGKMAKELDYYRKHRDARRPYINRDGDLFWVSRGKPETYEDMLGQVKKE